VHGRQRHPAHELDQSLYECTYNRLDFSFNAHQSLRSPDMDPTRLDSF
jgi:hypothetical protein